VGQHARKRESAFQVLERFYEAERRYMQAGGANAGASFEGMAATLDPDVLLHQSPDLPWGGEYRGHQGFKDWSIRMSECFDALDVRDPDYFEKGHKLVILCRLVTRSRLHGYELDRPMAQVVTVGNGRITEFRPFYWNVPEYVKAAAPA
jgi:ketosteroid isomerase-like protein